MSDHNANTILLQLAKMEERQVANAERLEKLEAEVSRLRALMLKGGSALLLLAGLSGSETVSQLLKSFLGQ